MQKATESKKVTSPSIKMINFEKNLYLRYGEYYIRKGYWKQVLLD